METYLAGLRKKSLLGRKQFFWQSIWKSAGRPKIGDLYRWKNHTKNQYHYAVRKSKKLGNLTRAKKLFEASISSDVDLLKEMKTIKQGGKACSELPEHVAGADGEEEIVGKFREVYQAL